MISPSERMRHRILNDESLIYWLFFSFRVPSGAQPIFMTCPTFRPSLPDTWTIAIFLFKLSVNGEQCVLSANLKITVKSRTLLVGKISAPLEHDVKVLTEHTSYG